MKKQIAIFLILITLTGISAHATNTKPINSNKPVITEKPVNKELIHRVLNVSYEHLRTSEAEYKAMCEKFSMNKPFTKLLKRQEMYIDMVTQLYKIYGFKEPVKDWDNIVKIPNTTEEYFSNSLIKEKDVTELYKDFLKEELPIDVRSGIYKLMELSANNSRLYKFILDAKAKKARE